MIRRASRVRAGAAGALAGLVLVLGCEKEKTFEPPDEEERVAQADSLYSPALFDSIAWESDEVRVREGDVIYAAACRRCHGSLGEGGTEYAASQGLDVPTLVDPGWEYADDIEEIRRRVFVGHAGGMPTWGVAHLTPREIDAASHYLLYVLRPEVLGEGPEAP